MLTVLIATYNGARTLPTLLEAFCNLEQPRGGWKLVVVDNGSTDSTEGIIRSFVPRLPLCYCYEPIRGKNAALNTGLSEVVGDLVVFTDDDGVPSPDWLTELRNVADARAAYDIFGGAIRPRWEREPPQSLLEWVPLGPAYGITDPGVEEGEIDAERLFGHNMAARARVFEAGYRFDPTVGPCGTDYAMGSETTFVRSLEESGIKCWFRPSAVMEHVIRDYQLKLPWIMWRARIAGRGAFRCRRQSDLLRGLTVLGVPSYLIRHMAIQAIRGLIAGLSADTKALFSALWNLNYVRGQAVESRIIAKSRNEPNSSAIATGQVDT